MPEEEGEGAIATFVVEQVAGALIGQAATQFIGGPLFGALGLGGDDDSAAYVEAVTAAIQQMGEQLSMQISAVQQGVAVVAALDLQILAYQSTEALSQLLQEFNNQATVITTNFTEFKNDVAALSATDTKATADALADMFTRLAPPNDTTIAEAMTDIHNLIVPPSGTRGIFDHICDVIQQAVLDAGQSALTPVSNPPSDWTTQGTLPSDMTYYESRLIPLAAAAPVAKEIPIVVSVMQSILSAQFEALLLLTKAWTGGPQEPSLKTYSDYLIAEIGVMNNFYSNCCAAATTGTSQALQQFGKPLTGTLLTVRWGNGDFVPDSTWLVWRVYSGPANCSGSPDNGTWHCENCIVSAVIVQAPWTGNPAPALSFFMTGFQNSPASWADADPMWFWFSNSYSDGWQYESLPAFNVPAPAVLTSLLSGLPRSDTQVKKKLAVRREMARRLR
jgi:hypothetical protein